MRAHPDDTVRTLKAAPYARTMNLGVAP